MTRTMHNASVTSLEPWQDARRTPPEFPPDAPDTFEWWYFDAQLTSGQALVVAFLIEPDAAAAGFVYRTSAVLTRPGKPPVQAVHRTVDDALISAADPNVRVGRAWFRGDGDTYRLVLDERNHAGLGMDLIIRRVVPGRVSPTGTDIVLGDEHGFGWVNAVPRGELAGTVTVDGQTTEVQGVAYHDHNWGGVSMASLVHHWLWGRATVGPYTAVFANAFPTRAYEVGDAGVQSLYIADRDGVLLNVCGAGEARFTAPETANPDSRNTRAYYAAHAVFEVEQAGRRVTVEVTPAQFLRDIDLAAETNNLTVDERARAAHMDVKPWYTEFQAAPVRLTIDDDTDEPARVYEGTGIVEFMDFHLNAE